MITRLVNIVLDLVLWLYSEWEWQGAALATAIAMIMSWLFSILYIEEALQRAGYDVSAP